MLKRSMVLILIVQVGLGGDRVMAVGRSGQEKIQALERQVRDEELPIADRRSAAGILTGMRNQVLVEVSPDFVNMKGEIRTKIEVTRDNSVYLYAKDSGGTSLFAPESNMGFSVSASARYFKTPNKDISSKLDIVSGNILLPLPGNYMLYQLKNNQEFLRIAWEKGLVLNVGGKDFSSSKVIDQGSFFVFVLPTAIEQVQNDSAEIRKLGIRKLAGLQVADDQIWEVLRGRTEDGDRDVRMEAERALAHLTLRRSGGASGLSDRQLEVMIMELEERRWLSRKIVGRNDNLPTIEADLQKMQLALNARSSVRIQRFFQETNELLLLFFGIVVSVSLAWWLMVQRQKTV